MKMFKIFHKVINLARKAIEEMENGIGRRKKIQSEVKISRHLPGGARCVMVIVAGNGHGDTSSNLGRD